MAAVLDCLWREQRLVVELDGRAVHQTQRAFEADRERDRILSAEGWRVIRVTWRQLRDDAEAVVTDMRAALKAAEALVADMRAVVKGAEPRGHR
ncbi:MAG TPA: DUF559 domain-containing protein [Solirubrobacterales bacterium]|nr:DUF559 domain-containing protein [Solirubrobacterales bacterium]